MFRNNFRRLTAIAACGAITCLSATGVAQDDKSKGEKEAKAKEIERATDSTSGELTKFGYVTFDQNEWGEPANSGQQAPRLLDKHFKEAFPDGLYLGDQDGKDDDDRYALQFMSPESVRRFLPQKGPPRTLVADSKDENPKLGGLAGQLLAARLNLRFNEMGAMKGEASEDGPRFGELVMAEHAEVPEMLVGICVRDIVDFGDRVIASEFGVYKENRKDGEVEYDITGDEKPDMSLRDVRVVLRLININFQNGKDRGALTVPTKKLTERAKPIRKVKRAAPELRIRSPKVDEDDDG